MTDNFSASFGKSAMERPDLERTMEQVLPYGKSITGKQDKLFKLVLVTYM
jgi:hypothetical protein